MSESLDPYLILSGAAVRIGTFGFLARRNAISMLMSIELMLNAVNLAIVAFGAFGVAVDDGAKTSLAAQGSIVALMVMAVAAARPTVASAAATAMTISAMTEPSATRTPGPRAAAAVPNEPNATIARLTPLSISSIDISMLIALRRARKPNEPIAKSSPDRTR